MMSGKNYRLNPNKSKLYELAKRRWPEMPKRKDTEFSKYPRARDSYLRFKSEGRYHRIILMVCGGRPTLCDDSWTYDESGDRLSSWETFPVSLDELKELGLVEETA